MKILDEVMFVTLEGDFCRGWRLVDVSTGRMVMILG